MKTLSRTVGVLGLVLGAPFAFAADPAVTPPGLPPGLEQLRRTERAFAKATGEIGFRNGFLMFFAEDAVAPPSLEPARKGLLAIPAPADYRPGTLQWEPKFGDVSLSNDMGYLTGPSSFTDSKGTPHTGVYFSIWRRDTTGLWLVVLDAGIDMPSPAPEFAGDFRAAARSGWKAGEAARDPEQDRASLMAVEAAFLDLVAKDPVHAYELHADADARMHRQGHHPLLGREAIVAHVQARPERFDGKTLRAVVSKAGDMGWTFGSAAIAAGPATKNGAFSHVWRRDDQGAWRLAVDVLNPPRE